MLEVWNLKIMQNELNHYLILLHNKNQKQMLKMWLEFQLKKEK